MRLAAVLLPALCARAALTPDQAAQLAELPLKCITREYPNKTGHTQESGADASLTPRQLHPSFYGCFDWHSSVHGHWMLVRLLRGFPLPNAARVRAVLDDSFAEAPLREEAAYFTRYQLARIFERTYGWAWLLKLDQELAEWPHADAARWRRNLAPLVEQVVRLWKEFLPRQTYPNRTGVHPNTAFGLVFALDWARKTGDTAFARLIEARARDYYLNSTAVTAIQEPDGTDFLSPALETADLMRRVLPGPAFHRWFSRYLHPRGLDNLLKPRWSVTGPTT